ncbi:BatA domain-containing protein [Pontibacter burrus]|uniref:Aerotolerance regulator N-terminal domain-containing protein n=1 Tax=Pontibacter burrus TaxID=2704466 RepID=A0A6B3LU50_9BACT|nr:BatA domain-containing protein [Pontibacter burrus]NEM96991.1 hypothetical protein [Pontibacter burrus]
MSFLYPSFLLALLATAIPVILHLVQLRRAKRVQFSNVRFIQASQEVTASQRKLKQLLILLCRILFLIFLVLAFAQPFIPGSVTNQASDNEVTIIVDNSYSMQNLHADQDLSLLAYTIDKARSVIGMFPPATVYNVLDNSSYTSNRFASAADAADNLNHLDFKASSSGSLRGAGAGHFFWFSDFQKNQFNPSDINTLPEKAQLHLIPIASAGTSNIFIDTVYLEDAFVRSGSESVLHAQIYNSGREVAEDVPVKLLINSQQVAAMSLDLQPQQATTATIKFRVGTGDLNLAALVVEDYPVEFDNTYYFTLTPSRGVRIVEIADKDVVDLKELYEKEPLFKYTRFNPENVDYALVGNSDVLLLNGLREFNSGLATTATNFVKDGGTVIVVPAPGTEMNGYDIFFNQVTIAARTVNPAASNKTELLAPASDNPFFSGIFATYDKKMQMPSAARTLQWARASDDILKYRGNSPFLSRFERGKGQVYLMAAPLQEDYTTLVNHALLLPLMYKMAITGYRQEHPLAYTLTTETVRVPVAQTTKGEGIYKLQKDSVIYIPEQQIRGGSLYFTIPPDMSEAGIYSLTLQEKPVSSIAFNYDNRESYLEQYTPEELRSMIGNDLPNVHVYDYGDAFSVKNEFEKKYFGVKLWKYCLILCLFFLMAEIALIRFL